MNWEVTYLGTSVYPMDPSEAVKDTVHVEADDVEQALDRVNMLWLDQPGSMITESGEVERYRVLHPSLFENGCAGVAVFTVNEAGDIAREES